MNFLKYCKELEDAHNKGEIISLVVERHIVSKYIPSDINAHARKYRDTFLSTKNSMYKRHLEDAKELNAVSVYTYVIKNKGLQDYVSHHFFNNDGLEVAYLIEDMEIFSPLESPRIVCDEIKDNYVFRETI